MSIAFTPTRASLTGLTVLMACACGAGANSAKLLGVSSKVTHSFLLGIGAVLLVGGLYRISRTAGFFAIGSMATLLVAAALTPPMVMTTSRLPWHGSQIAGGFLYLVVAAALAYAFWISFPMPRPGAAATAMTGTAVASGCSCCMVTGAVAGLMATFGGDPAIFVRQPVVFFSGIILTGLGLGRMAGIRPLPWLVAGALITRFGGRGLQLLGDWMVADVNLRFIPGYAMYVIGAGLVVKAWAVAYEPAPLPSRGEQAIDRVPQPAL